MERIFRLLVCGHCFQRLAQHDHLRGERVLDLLVELGLLIDLLLHDVEDLLAAFDVFLFYLAQFFEGGLLL